MTRIPQQLQTLTLGGILMLLGAVCLVESGAADRVSENRTATEAEDVQELSEFSDAELSDAVLGHEFALIHGHGINERLLAVQECSVLRRAWSQSSRGPPV